MAIFAISFRLEYDRAYDSRYEICAAIPNQGLSSLRLPCFRRLARRRVVALEWMWRIKRAGHSRVARSKIVLGHARRLGAADETDPLIRRRRGIAAEHDASGGKRAAEPGVLGLKPFVG